MTDEELIALYIGLYSPINISISEKPGKDKDYLIALYIGLYSHTYQHMHIKAIQLIALYIGLYSQNEEQNVFI